MSSEKSGLPPVEGPEGSGETAIERGPFGGQWDRRTLFKGAALGTAAAAMYEGGALFKPLAAFAHDLSTLNCTANDVRIAGPGIILNEPCICSGTFNAQVQFHIINNTGTTRYCVTTHLCAGKNANGDVVVPAQDIVFGDIAANFDGNVTVTIANYPCGSGLVCFGVAGSAPDGGFAKGENCPTGQCCSTITWNVKASDPCPDTTRQISSKCRHQQICIQGRGITTVDCDLGTSGNQTSCAVPCGSTATVRVCTTNSATLGPFRFQLDGQSFGPTAATCHDFTVGPITENTTFTATVTDASGCARTAQVTLTTSAISPTLSVSGEGACDGVLTFSTSVEGFSGCTFTYTIDGMSVADANAAGAEATVNADGTLTFRWLDGNCHTVAVAAACGDCEGSDSITVSQCVNTTTNCTP
jgi:hypothetical protein